MKKAGLIGGMGPQSTMPYYLGIAYGVRQKTRPDFFPNITIECINVFEVLDYCARADYDGLTLHILRAVRNLAAAGADFAVLTANTTHIIFDRLKPLSPIPLISIIDTVRDEALARGYRKVALLGTVFTMTRDFYKKPFREAGIEVVVPNDPEMQLINDRINNELELGIVTDETLTLFREIISRLRDSDGAEAVILGCTELPLLLNDDNSPLPTLDTVAIHTRAIINTILD
ncbi:MAG: amino acid racemase [Muribaculaceae bacterium]|nr:amino acid racemase [Muribaculaceae bacterium]